MPPLIHPQTPRVAVPCGCALGEQAVWDHRTGTLLWVDIEEPALWRHRPEGGEPARLALDEPLGFVALTEDPDTVVAGFRSGLARLRLSGGPPETILVPEPDRPGNRLNGGTVAPDGALYFGSMDAAEAQATGTFYRWDGRDLTRFGGQMPVTNGPAASPDGRTLYTVDTAAGTVRAHGLAQGGVGEARALVQFEPGWGKPDGLTVDAEGCIWVCHYGGSRVTRFTPDGEAILVVPVPTALVTHCAFIGPDLATLAITTARRDRDPRIDPMAGHLFVVETGNRGQPSRSLAV
ncbi:SMP-30/gluconolactonase/LRE family protein [Methylobacterium oryzisoli]|uniref:SMP-30/gluconolactonase/LRE family protein n=1 Tax=Methylobacterium oryzisoli TaxID=3385502 RepID=UPI0038917278